MIPWWNDTETHLVHKEYIAPQSREEIPEADGEQWDVPYQHEM